MYTKQEAAQRREAFWTAFGRYMAPLPSASGDKVNWVNYKTGEPGIVFKMDADTTSASIAILLSHKDDGIRQLYYEQLLQLKKVLEATLGEQWGWLPDTQDEYGKAISKVQHTITGVNVMNQADWPALISFFKPRIIALDEFWDSARYVFEALR